MTESLAWTCSRCGAWCWNHHEHCAACGLQKPAPPPAETPTDEQRPEPPWRIVADSGRVRLGAFAPSLPHYAR